MAEIVSTRPIAGIGTPDQNPEAPALPALAGQRPATPGRILVRRAIKATAEHFGTSPDVLASACRTQPHTTVLHGVRAVKSLLDAGDGEIVAAVGAIIERLQVTAGAALIAVSHPDGEALI